MTTHPDLSKQIEDLVRQHVDALQASAAAAVARAFAAVSSPSSARASTSTQTRPARPRKKAAPRRGPEELVALGERFYTVLCQRPGETMATLATQVALRRGCCRSRSDGCGVMGACA